MHPPVAPPSAITLRKSAETSLEPDVRSRKAPKVNHYLLAFEAGTAAFASATKRVTPSQAGNALR